MRAFRDIETLHQFMDGYLTYYNYFKPNEALRGKTPAEAAKVDYRVKNWKDLCSMPVAKPSEPKSQPRVTVREVPTSFDIVQPRRAIGITRKPPRAPKGVDLGADIVRDRRGRHLRLY